MRQLLLRRFQDDRLTGKNDMRWLLRTPKRLYAAYAAFNKDDGSLMAAATAYFIGLSLFPLLTVLIAAVGWFLQYTNPGQDAQVQVMNTVRDHVSPIVAEQVGSVLDQVQQKSAVGGRLGLLTLLFTAIAGFAQFQQAFDKIWNLAPPPDRGMLATIKAVLVERGVAFLMLLSIGAIVVAGFLASTVMATLQAQTTNLLPDPAKFWTLMQTGLSVSLNVGAFTLLYRWLPKVRVRWRDAFAGAVFAAIGWELGRQVLAAFLIGTKYSSAYGVVGTFIGLLVWCYYACVVIFLGAEYVQARYCEARGEDPSKPAC